LFEGVIKADVVADQLQELGELRQALERKGIEPDIAEQVLGRLDEVGLVDDKAFADPSRAAAGRATLAKNFDGLFSEVKSGNYDKVLAALPLLSADADMLLAPKDAAPVKSAIGGAAKMAEHGMARKAKRL